MSIAQQTIGEMRAGLTYCNRRIDSIQGELRWHVLRLERRMDRKRNGGIPWKQLAAMGTVASISLLGLVRPEAATALLAVIVRALLH